MGILLLSALSVVLFCLSARQLIVSITQVSGLATLGGEFSKRALRIERGYKVFAWASLTLFLFVSMLTSFLEAFMQL